MNIYIQCKKKKKNVYLINHVSVETRTTGRMIPFGTNSPLSHLSTW